MAKLTLRQMIDLAEGKADVEGVSEKQREAFNLAETSDESPAYMQSFWKEYRKPLTAGTLEATKPAKANNKRYLLTVAQNNTEPFMPFVLALENFAEYHDAEILVGKCVYNKNGFQNGTLESEDVYFSSRLAKYYRPDLVELVDGLVWCGNLNVLPTAKYPLSGFENYQGSKSLVVPHAKIAMESIATMKELLPKFLYSTGAVTQRNYIQKKSGQLAEASHCYGALLVEVSNNGVWHARQIEACEDGSFQDLNTVYQPDGTIKPGSVDVINWGDIHSEKADWDILRKCVEMRDYLNPVLQVFHDTFDMTSRNHHNRANPMFLAEMGTRTVADDIKDAAKVLEYLLGSGKGIVVESNHDLALDRWLEDTNYKFQFDPQNAETYLRLMLFKYQSIGKDESIGTLQYALENIAGMNQKKLLFLNTDQSFVINGIELGMHGHVGANGSRGSPKQFTKLNIKANTGHTHAASIYNGVYTAGVTGSLDMGYNIGPSSWSHSHILTYGNGKRTIVTMKDGEWKG